MTQKITVGIVGARGYVGIELIRLIAAHPVLELVFVSSRELVGQPVAASVSAFSGALVYETLDAEAVAERGADVVILALPNGKAHDYVAALVRCAPQTLIIDLSADYRFDAAWFYGLPELYRENYSGQRRISNPGCYATAMQLAIAPMSDVLADAPQCFAVSGYSGAGTTPSDKNDPQKLQDNLMPYALIGHVHEREVTRHLGLAVEFMPHVAEFFRGINMTVNLHLARRFTRDEILARYREKYADQALINVQDDVPWVSQNASKHHTNIGGFVLDQNGQRLVVVATLDNLLKGAATQALQNINLALGLDELSGIVIESGNVHE
ncbi:N-acetyl-gamma-glutamyl-phosphate reductase [Pseudolysobacter antarcticus]|uniref:N-acetyl-gamma-glutamyl-phosphate reductase n=1 Tax=Pseudolysobacter antarcticus TaxID=2511995 RepID=A0A411HIF5_9GAMM|nr:N-acetyl-gamma-glutamyl-phosphate reductase [Pseudolysobacter antarcticus]QBB70261.1 N-acetyl-gamma-glutamyl-phosphate reductase [Pseudolysobacter antarcticus]